MTHEEKAEKVLDHLFSNPRYYRVGLSEKFLRNYARKKWVGPNMPLSGNILLLEAAKRVQDGRLITFRRGKERFYAPKKKTAGGNFGELPRLSRHQTRRGA